MAEILFHKIKELYKEKQKCKNQAINESLVVLEKEFVKNYELNKNFINNKIYDLDDFYLLLKILWKHDHKLTINTIYNADSRFVDDDLKSNIRIIIDILGIYGTFGLNKELDSKKLEQLENDLKKLNNHPTTPAYYCYKGLDKLFRYAYWTKDYISEIVEYFYRIRFLHIVKYKFVSISWIRESAYKVLQKNKENFIEFDESIVDNKENIKTQIHKVEEDDYSSIMEECLKISLDNKQISNVTANIIRGLWFIGNNHPVPDSQKLLKESTANKDVPIIKQSKQLLELLIDFNFMEKESQFKWMYQYKSDALRVIFKCIQSKL